MAAFPFYFAPCLSVLYFQAFIAVFQFMLQNVSLSQLFVDFVKVNV